MADYVTDRQNGEEYNRSEIQGYNNNYDGDGNNIYPRKSASREPPEKKPLSASDITAIAESTVSQLLLREEQRSDDRRSYRRSRSRDKSRGRDHSPSRNRSRNRSRSRSRGRRSRSREQSAPDRNSSMSRLEKLKDPRIVTLKGLKAFHKENDIRRKLIDERMRFRDIRVIFNKATQSGTAFVEFSSENEAARWVRYNRGMLRVAGEHLTMDLCKPTSVPRKDWICALCNEKNHYARDSCYSCQSEKVEAKEKPRLRSKSPTDAFGRDRSANVQPSNVLMFRGLDYRTDDDHVLRKLKEISDIPIKDVRLITDKYTNKSRGFCFVEVSSVEDGKALYTTITKMDPPFDIHGRRVTVSYQREPSSESNEKAQSAIAAAQWSANPTDDNTNTTAAAAAVATENKETPKSMPDVIGTYVYDEKSGYYYDESSGLYYDPKTKYYYNPTDQQYYYWDPQKNQYENVTAASQTTADNTTTTENKTEENTQKEKPCKATKAMNAKKIQKDMERWAKAKNRQQAKLNPPKSTTEPEPEPENTTNVQTGNSIALKIAQDYADPAYQSTQQPPQLVPPPPAIFPITSLTTPTITDDFINRKHEDLAAMACLLCKRKFPSADNLKRHQELSDLHKTNLTAERQRMLADGGQGLLDASGQDYRDRAQERRSKFGSEAPPPHKFMRR